MKTAEPIFVTVKEAARLLGISPWTCYQIIKAGELEGRRRGSRIVVPLVAVTAYAESLPPVHTPPEEESA